MMSGREAEHDICLQTGMAVSPAALQTISCENGTDHSKYKDLSSFGFDDLPLNYQHEEMFNLVKSLADLTVMIQLPCSDNPERFWQGTGKVDDVFIYTGKNPCPCLECKKQQNPDKKSKEWGHVRIVTSASLLSACKKVTSYKCTLFYDEDNTLDKRKVLFGEKIVCRTAKKDICKFICATCDIDLLRKLDGYVDTFVNNWHAALEKYYNTVKSAEDKLLVMVSHPHGCKKHVSIGKWSKLKPRVQHDAATCPGCSGSYLLIPNFDVDDNNYT